MAYEKGSVLYEDVCYLCKPITETVQGRQQKITGWQKREVFCQVASLYMREFFYALQNDIQEAYRVDINLFEWEDGREKVVELGGKMYSVYRTYMKGDTISLFVHYKAGKPLGVM